MKLAAVATAAIGVYALGWFSRQPAVAAARREASTDALTGLSNRTGLKRQLRDRAKRGEPYTLYMIDLNGFKPINDTFGHRAGDQLLQQIAWRLAAQLHGHQVARLGGDEFVVVGAGRHQGPQLLTDQINRAIEMPTVVTGSLDPVTLTAAVGLVHAPMGADYREVLHTADLAMYRSKTTGRACQVSTLTGRPVEESPQVRVRDTRPVRVA